MSRSKTELSVTERLIIQLVIYRTKNPKHPTFFGDNKNIAKCIDVQPDTVRKAIAKLVKLEYLQLGLISKVAAIWSIPVKNLHRLLRI